MQSTNQCESERIDVPVQIRCSEPLGGFRPYAIRGTSERELSPDQRHARLTTARAREVFGFSSTRTGLQVICAALVMRGKSL